MTLNNKTALIIGGSRGVGRALALAVASRGNRTIAVARNQQHLDSLKKESSAIETIATDASADGVAAKLLGKTNPDLLILAGGHQPKMQALSENSWEEFSAAWNTDTKIAFEFTKAALLAPMTSGGTIVSFASGAALGGSPLSGGYAGAKRMQHFVSNYAKWEAEKRDLDLTFVTIYPKQLIAGSSIAEDASTAYADAASISREQFMSQWEKPLTPDAIAAHVIGLLDGKSEIAPAYGVTGVGIEALA